MYLLEDCDATAASSPQPCRRLPATPGYSMSRSSMAPSARVASRRPPARQVAGHVEQHTIMRFHAPYRMTYGWRSVIIVHSRRHAGLRLPKRQKNGRRTPWPSACLPFLTGRAHPSAEPPVAPGRFSSEIAPPARCRSIASRRLRTGSGSASSSMYSSAAISSMTSPPTLT